MILGWLVGGALAAPVTADEVVRAALAHDPALAAAQAEVRSAEGARRAATGLRYDPTLEARVGFGLPQHEAALTQPVSLSGEGVAAARVAAAELRAALAERDRRRLEVAAEARWRLIRGIAADAEAARTDEVLRLTTELRGAAERRLASGDVAALEVHLARLEEAAAAADHAQARREALAAREDLAATTGLPPGAELPTDPLDAAPAPAAGGARDDQGAAAARLTGAEAAVRRARAAALPPVDLGVWAQVQNIATTPGTGGVDVAPWSWSENAAWTVGPTVSMTLPVWSANRAGIAQAEGARDAAEAHRDAVDARIGAEAAGSADRRAILSRVAATADPSVEARSALAGLEAAVGVGELGPADAALLRARVLDAWGRAARARADAAGIAVDLALAESWATLLGGSP